MASDKAREWALTIGAQLAAIEAEIGAVNGMVMRAAMQHNNNLVANQAQVRADMLDDMCVALSVNLREFRKALRS